MAGSAQLSNDDPLTLGEQKMLLHLTTVRQQWSLLSSSVFRKTIVMAFLAGAVQCHIAKDCQAQSNRANQVAHWKSQRLATIGIQRLRTTRPSPYSIAPMGMRHVRPLMQPLGVRKEGVGYSPSSPGQAIRNACHFGQRPVVAKAVVRGRDGYYATVFYR